MCICIVCSVFAFVFVFALYLNGSAGESWNMRLGSLRLSSQRNPRLSFVTKVRDGKKHWRRLFSFSLAVLSSMWAVHTLLMSSLAIHFLMIRIRKRTKIITTSSQSMTMKAQWHHWGHIYNEKALQSHKNEIAIVSLICILGARAWAAYISIHHVAHMVDGTKNVSTLYQYGQQKS